MRGNLLLGFHRGGMGAGRYGSEHVLFALDKRGSIETGDFKAVAVSDGVGRARFYAISTKNTAVVINVVDARITLAAGDPQFFGIFRGFDIDALGGARRRA